MSKCEVVKERMAEAMNLDSWQIVEFYRESLRYGENPLSDIFENEILRRLWTLEEIRNRVAREEN